MVFELNEIKLIQMETDTNLSVAKLESPQCAIPGGGIVFILV